MNPWNDIDSAFDPMFDEEIVVKFTRNGEPCSRTLKVYVVSGATSDSMSEDIIDAQGDTIDVIARKEDCEFVSTLKRGDVVVRPMFYDRTYAVEEVKYDELMHLVVRARSSRKGAR